MIPQDIKDKIEAEINSIYKLDTDGQRIARGVYRTAAEFGYNLASPKQDEFLNVWNAARETVLMHHYNGSERPAAYMDKYNSFDDYVNNNPRQPN